MGTKKSFKRTFNNLYTTNKKYRIKKDLQRFILDQDHPCIMAQILARQKNIEFDIYSKMESSLTAQKLLKNIGEFIENYDFEDDYFKSYFAVFPDEKFNSEEDFENAMWELLRFVNLYDKEPWDYSVSKNTENCNFSFSIQGKAFYIVGMHPKSSRTARQTKYPVLVLHLHWQFEQLRKRGLYQKIKNHIRQREIEKNGSVNPVLKDFGKASEAIQYSGRNNSSEWKCPFLKN